MVSVSGRRAGPIHPQNNRAADGTMAATGVLAGAAWASAATGTSVAVGASRSMSVRGEGKTMGIWRGGTTVKNIGGPGVGGVGGTLV